mmetsp:Transcript_55690/g.88319  ORF Transcript_55690/g.88319 Transcript_55690/m.88319 type:complete len:244 (+) Transcript_55690:38-769(+)
MGTSASASASYAEVASERATARVQDHVDVGGESCVFRMLPRANSVDVVNDPRIVQDSVVGKRFHAFQAIAVGATLMASLAVTTAIGIMGLPMGWEVGSCLASMLLCFCMNILAVLVISQQFYQFYRLSTSGSHGFEIAQSYYVSEDIVKLRHTAVQSYFKAFPIFVIGIALMGYAKMEDEYPITGIVVLSLLVVCGIFMFVIISRQKQVFRKHWEKAREFQRPLGIFMDTAHGRSHDDDRIYG